MTNHKERRRMFQKVQTGRKKRDRDMTGKYLGVHEEKRTREYP